MGLWMRCLVCIFILCSVGQVASFSTFQDRIPNGHAVPHPCRENYVWHGIGHINKDGGGARNIFGKAFDAAGKQWTTELCKADTDGDGMTNGEELGDPDCTWTPGNTPFRTDGITHPGICDKFDALECFERNQWVDCSSLDFECDAVNGTGVKTFEVKVQNLTVPAWDTTYVCSMVDLPVDGDYHIFAEKPIIDNRRVLHHMVLFGCDPRKEISRSVNEPYYCGMVPHRNCQTVLMVWTLGLSGECLDDTIGIRIGMNGFRKGAIQIHWNNPEKTTGMTDSSGMKFYYTAKRRPNDIMVLTVGQQYLEIPPREKSITFTGDCAEECTERYFAEPLHLVSVLNHMHYLGRKAAVEIYRNGTRTARIAVDEEYHYDDPKTHRINPPLVILPGDRIKATCTFNSETSKKTTHWGDATSDEMCFTFMTVYPAHALRNPMCVSFKSLPDCVVWDPVLSERPYNGCNFVNVSYFMDAEFNKLASSIIANCKTFEKCYPECLEATKAIYKHPCTNGDIWGHIKIRMGRNTDGFRFLARMESCRGNLTVAEDTNGEECTNRASSVYVAPSCGLVLALEMFPVIMYILKQS